MSETEKWMSMMSEKEKWMRRYSEMSLAERYRVKGNWDSVYTDAQKRTAPREFRYVQYHTGKIRREPSALYTTDEPAKKAKPAPKLANSAFPNCCTGTVVFGFGGSIVAGNSRNFTKVEEIMDSLLEIEEQYARSGYAFLSATTNNEQTLANEALEKAGFESSGWMSKKKHPETKVKLWWKPIN